MCLDSVKTAGGSRRVDRPAEWRIYPIVVIVRIRGHRWENGGLKGDKYKTKKRSGKRKEIKWEGWVHSFMKVKSNLIRLQASGLWSNWFPGCNGRVGPSIHGSLRLWSASRPRLLYNNHPDHAPPNSSPAHWCCHVERERSSMQQAEPFRGWFMLQCGLSWKQRNLLKLHRKRLFGKLTLAFAVKV